MFSVIGMMIVLLPSGINVYEKLTNGFLIYDGIMNSVLIYFVFMASYISVSKSA